MEKEEGIMATYCLLGNCIICRQPTDEFGVFTAKDKDLLPKGIDSIQYSICAHCFHAESAINFQNTEDILLDALGMKEV
jgi:hypothetical protein